MTLLADLVATSAAVAATSGRTAKTEALADLLRKLDPDEVEVAVDFLTGTIRHGSIGVGWATASKLRGTADEPSVEVARLHAVFGELLVTVGEGSQAQRAQLLQQEDEAGRAGTRRVIKCDHAARLGLAAHQRKRMQAQRAGQRARPPLGVDLAHQRRQAAAARGAFQHRPEFRLQRHAGAMTGKGEGFLLQQFRPRMAAWPYLSVFTMAGLEPAIQSNK